MNNVRARVISYDAPRLRGDAKQERTTLLHSMSAPEYKSFELPQAGS